MIKNIIKSLAKPYVKNKNIKYLNRYYSDISKYGDVHEDFCDEKMNVLVVAPHQDDETIGLGGTISKLKKNGSKVTVVYMTDGRLERDGVNKLEISNIRKEEAKKACRILDIDDIVFLECENLKVKDNVKRLSDSLFNIVSNKKFDRIYSTSLSEFHEDHRYSSVVLADVLGKIKDYSPQIFMYEINNSLQKGSVNTFVSLESDEVEKKLNAFNLYKSQTGISFEIVNIIQTSKGSISEEKPLAAEIFYKIDAEDFIKAAKKDNEVFKDMKNATNFFRLVENYNHNMTFTDKIKELYRI